MRQFWDLVKESTIAQGVITLCVIGTSCYLFATGQPVPESLLAIDWAVLGFFFGAKVQQAIK